MKAQIHPTYHVTEVSCGCGASFVTRSTRPVIKLEICSSCHPFYTGRQKFVDTAGRVEKFTRKFNWGTDAGPDAPAEGDARGDRKGGKAKKAPQGEQETFKTLAKKTKKALADGAKKQIAAAEEAAQQDAGKADE